MGCSNSKGEKDEALRLCRERRRFMKQAIDSRYSLAASHVSYTESLRQLGVALRRHAEAEAVVVESSLSISHSSPSPSSHLPDSPLGPATTLNYMKSGPAETVTVTLSPGRFADEFPMQMSPLHPPPPPPPDGSWDFFDGDENDGSFRFAEPRFEEAVAASPVVEEVKVAQKNVAAVAAVEEREDQSEFITHRAKDYLSSIKDIEHRFFRASEAGKETARMLEGNKIRVGYCEAKGRSSSSPSALAFLQALQIVCCHRDSAVLSHEQGGKVITWKRTTSSRSSSSRNPLTSKDDGNDSGSDFAEEFSMIAGSHSSTLDRLFAWEKKLYDEVKASESIRKEYDRRCEQLRIMFAKDYSSQVIDKTRSVVKDLHSRIRVAIQSVDSISKRIEKMRDEELHPQLVELTHAMIRMWKSMLESHHAQYITISLAYHSTKSAGAGTPRGDAHRQLMEEVECFGVSFADWINSLTSYVESLNAWLHHSIIPPRERSTRRRPFSPRRYLGPPIFVLVRDWTAAIRTLPSDDLTAAIRAFLEDLREEEDEAKSAGLPASAEEENKNESHSPSPPSSMSSSIQGTLTKVLDKLTKFSEESLKMYEDLKQKNEAARVAYSNSRSRF